MNIGERRILELERIGAGGFHTSFHVCRWLGEDYGWALEHSPMVFGEENQLDLSRDRIAAIHTLPARKAELNFLDLCHKVDIADEK